jgi:hypothetical protein
VNQCWEKFIESVPWLLKRGQTAEVEDSQPAGSWVAASSDFDRLFPELSLILHSAVVTCVMAGGRRYHLYTWLRPDGCACDWLSPLPSADPMCSLHPDHRVLLTSFGGIVERSNEPEWWILNHNDVLTERLAHGNATFIRSYAWAFEEACVEIPVDLDAFYPIAEEANRNTTFCHRLSGEVVLFAHDHTFDHVEQFPGCPPYTFYRLSAASRLPDWVNAVALQWRTWIESVD